MRARELTVDEAERPLGWRYPGQYATYDAEGPLRPELGFFAVEDDTGDFVGYACVGADGLAARGDLGGQPGSSGSDAG